MKLCHLYYKKSSSSHKAELLSSFEGSISIDINKFEYFNQEYDIYIIELGKVNKALSLKVKEIFSTLVNPLIYFLIPTEYNLSLFQLAFMLNAKTIITQSQDIKKVILKIHQDYNLHREYCNSMKLGCSLVNHHSYMIFKDSKLDFVSEQLLRDFCCTDLQQIQKQICSKLDMQKILSNENAINRITARNINETTYLIKSVVHQDEVIISFEANSDYEEKCVEVSYVSTRLSFVELLKDKLLEKMMSNKHLSILVIKMQKVSKTLSNIDEEYFRKEFLLEVELILSSKIMLAQFDRDIYTLLFEDISFENLQDKAENFHLQIARFLNRQKVKYILSLFTIDIDELEINPILKSIEQIAKDNVDTKLTNSKNIKYINNLQDNMQEAEIIDYMLDTIYLNSTDLKLLNIYNGMCITTASKIIKKTDDSIYVQIEHVQGTIMELSKKTILQSSILTKSIKASVKYINQKEKYAILHRFVILDYNPNERQHGRVSGAKVIPIAISLTGSKVKGEVIDISATSIAIKVKKSKLMNNLLNKDIDLIFYLENQNTQSGSTKLQERATVIYESYDNDGYCKLVCVFLENPENENILIEYIFNRQKSIIQEMKNMTK